VIAAPSHKGGCQPASYRDRAQDGEVSSAEMRERFAGGVAIVIPAYEEEENLAELLPRIPSSVCGVHAAVLVVDDGSGDDTSAAAIDGGAVVARLAANAGGGAALRVGYELVVDAGAEIVVTMDADGQHRPEDIERLVAPVRSGRAQLAQGSRTLGHAEGGVFYGPRGIYEAAGGGVGTVLTQLCVRAGARVAAADDHVVGFQRRAELCNDFADDAAPFLDSQLFQAVLADPLLVSAFLLIAQMREFHGRDDAIDDQGGAEAGAEPEKQHSATFVTADCLHGCIVDDVGRPAKRSVKIESDPTGPQIVRFRGDFAVEHYSRIPDGDGIVGPVPGELMHARRHLTRVELRSRFELTQLASAENAHLHMASADVDGEYSPVVPWLHAHGTIPQLVMAHMMNKRLLW